MKQILLDRIILPFLDHYTCGAAVSNVQRKNGVVAGPRVQDGRKLFRIQAQRQRVFLMAVKDTGDPARGSEPASHILARLASNFSRDINLSHKLPHSSR